MCVSKAQLGGGGGLLANIQPLSHAKLVDAPCLGPTKLENAPQ